MQDNAEIPYHIEKTEISRMFDRVGSFEQNNAFKDVVLYNVSLGPVRLVPMGITCLKLVPEKEFAKAVAVKAANYANIMENSLLKIEFNSDGSFNLHDKATGRDYFNLNQFEDGGDRGDMYIFTKPENDLVVSSLGRTAVIGLDAESDGFTRYKAVQTISVPESIADIRDKRSSDYIDMEITSYITLGKDSRRVDITTEFDNNVRDHRLRALFPSGINSEYSEAETPFDVVKRKVKLPEFEDWFEDPSPFHPQQNFVDVNDGMCGLLLANKGLNDYELKEDGVVAITLIRAIQWGSRGDLYNCKKQRKPDGTPVLPYMNEPEAQCLGKQTCRYSIIPHLGDWLASGAWKEAYNHKTGAFPVELPSGYIGRDMQFISIDNENIGISAVKKSDEYDALILRLHNMSNNQEVCRLKTVFKIGTANYVNLLEESLADISINADGEVRLDFKRKEILTVALYII